MSLPVRWLLFLVLFLAACATQETNPTQPRNPAQPTPAQNLSSPSNFRAVAVSPTSADLSWNEVPGATHYTLERRPSSGSVFSAVGGNLSGSMYRDTGLSQQTSYVYHLRAVNEAGSSAAIEVGVTTPAQTSAPPTSPSPANLPACSSIAFSASGTGLNPSVFTQALNQIRATPCSCASRSYPNPSAAVGWNPQLETAALSHSQDMQQNNFFSHTSSNDQGPNARITNQGYRWSTYGENIAAGYPSMEAVLRTWLRSTSGHCEAIKSTSYTEIGAALVLGTMSNSYPNYWTLNFAKPR